MDAHSMPYSKIIDVEQGAREHYHVPKYQREYTWGKADWERLILDIEENDPGYFMGSIICVKDASNLSPGEEQIYEVIDGQQRLTTLSLLIMAVFEKLKAQEETIEFSEPEDKDDFQHTLTSLRNKLVKRKTNYNNGERGGFQFGKAMYFLRVQPSSQNHNLDDYLFLLSSIGLTRKQEKPRYCGVRSMQKALRFFQQNTSEDCDELLALVHKINQLMFVMISVDTHADAFTLFETLNNRGVPLSAVDIVKNKMLAEMDRNHSVNIDESYERWQELISSIPSASDQERFLRQFYNAFRWKPEIRVEGIPRAVKSKIISIYENLIMRDTPYLFTELCSGAEIYGRLIAPQENGYPGNLRSALVDLEHVNASPAYLILLYLFSLPDGVLQGEGSLVKAVDLLVKYYVRRNVTDFPATRRLDQLHMELVEKCQREVEKTGHLTFDFFSSVLLASNQISPLDEFTSALNGGIYAQNRSITRFLLIKLDEIYKTREYVTDLWAKNERGVYVWTVEHILPQTEKISPEWIQMIGNGDEDVAKAIHERHVHCLGNLTLSGYNSKLATSPFAEKQALVKDKKFLGHMLNIGYKNGLALNNFPFEGPDGMTSLAGVAEWTEDAMIARGASMVKALLDLYRFDFEPKNEQG